MSDHKPIAPECLMSQAEELSRRQSNEQSSLAATAGSAAGATVIESTGEVDGCDATAQTISVKISMRPSGVRLGDACWLKWQRHPLPPNPSSATGRE